MVLTSTVCKIRKGTKSMRATIPEGIVEFLDLEDGQQISWIMKSGRTRSVEIRSVSR